MKLLNVICAGLSLLMVAPLWSQVEQSQVDLNPSQSVTTFIPADEPEQPIQAPPPISGQVYSMAFTSEERSNYLRGGVAFTAAYTDNALGGLSGSPVSDVSYSVAPTLALDETSSRIHATLTYAPGFTFYQRLSSRNEADQNASIDFRYRLSPHVTFSAIDRFQKSSNVFNQPSLTSTEGVSGGTQQPNFSILAPIASRLSNFGSVGLNYQFSLNSMVGANGTFSNLHYPDPAEVPGLFDTSSQGGTAFYSLRILKDQYIGASYQYQRLIAYLPAASGETQTQAAIFFYSFLPSRWFTLSFFGGPQHSQTNQPAQPQLQLQSVAAKSWTPAAGTSFGFQSLSTSFAASYSHLISSGGGLIG